jgi:DNA topoisomerase-3
VGKTLVIAEKPSVGRDLAAALPGSFHKEDGHLESSDTIITWAVGHLVTLRDPEEYDERFKRWSLDNLPIAPERFELKPRTDAKTSKKQLELIRKLMLRDDVERIVNACDAGREGELIFAYIYEWAGSDKPVDRLWINSMTKQAISQGFEHLRPREQMTPLEEAARSRSEADWLIGMNATRAATIRRGWGAGVVSLGRVQTPTLAMIVRREREIQAFVPEPYWLVHGTFESPSRAGYAGLWFEGNETRIWNPKQEGGVPGQRRAADIVARVSGKEGVVESVERKEQTERAPLLYDLTSLQRDANQRFGFSARRTLQTAQSLYEGRKAITYPRTSSRYISGDMVSLIKPTVSTLAPISEYAQAARYVLALDRLPLSRVVDDAKVDDHHAIIPTDIEHDVDRLTPDERRIFDLVAKRFLAVFHPPARYARTTVISNVEGETFRTRGKITLEAGWRGVYGVEPDDPTKQDEEGEGGELPKLEQGMAIRCVEAAVEAKETKPPPRFTEATLLSAMETAGKLVEDEELAEAMKDRGLGTPATRAEIIETLIRRSYIERIGKELAPAPKGMEVVAMLDNHPLTRPDLTGDWEKRLMDIEHGRDRRAAFMADIKAFTSETVQSIAELDPANFRTEFVELGPCPRCGAETGERIKENRRAYGCTSWKSREEPGCGFVIWKRVAGRTLTPEVARQLIEEGRTREVLTGFKSRAGKSFRARLVMTSEGKVEFEFPERAGTPVRAAADAE